MAQAPTHPLPQSLYTKLEDSDSGVRRTAVVGKLETETLAQHAPSVGPARLAQHAPAVLAKLGHCNEDVRTEAVRTLDKLGPATLAQHAGAVIAKLEDSEGALRPRGGAGGGRAPARRSVSSCG